MTRILIFACLVGLGCSSTTLNQYEGESTDPSGYGGASTETPSAGATQRSEVALAGSTSTTTPSGGSGGTVATAPLGGSAGLTSTGGTGSLPNELPVCSHGIPSGPSIAPGFNGNWGSQSDVVGGSFLSQTNSLSKFSTDSATTPGSVTLTASQWGGEYSGFGVYFKDPDKCFDLSGYTGIQLKLSGNLGGSRLRIVVETNGTYPVDLTNGKGGCLAKTCSAPYASVNAISATPTVYQFAWSRFASGQPVATVDPTEVVGIRFDAVCPVEATAQCSPSITIGAVSLF